MSDENTYTRSYEEALALHTHGNFSEAERAYAAILQKAPDHVEALHGIGVLCMQSRRVEQAVQYLQRAVAAGGSNVVRNNLGVALCAAGRLAEAADVYREIVKTDTAAVSAYLNLGQILNQMHAYTEAVEILHQALALTSQDGRIHDQLAVALAECQHTMEANAHFERAVALMPARTDFLCDWGSALLKSDHPQQAAECYRRALTIAQNSPAALCGLGEAMGKLGRHEEAIAHFRQACAAAPAFALAYYNCGTAQTYLGRTEEAEQNFCKAVELEPDNAAYRSALIGIRKTTADNVHFLALEKMAVSAAHLPPQEEMELQFTLAKAYDDVGDYSRAKDAIARGCAIKRQLEPYDVQADLDRIQAIIRVFTANFLQAYAGCGDPTQTPIFIIGMPRSGTTLVEQIVASHPVAFGAGELSLLPDLINSGFAGHNFPYDAASLDSDAWRTLGAQYAKTLRARAPNAQRITDKRPFNFQLVGLIRLAMPKAKIIHVRRNPFDTCFSCYSTLFAQGLGFTYDLENLGRYYRSYERIMAHWRAVFPPEYMLEISYESLIENFEGEAKKLISYCGLDWNERCLNFYETKRTVETASTMQVRRPVYKTSIGRAAAYAPWLTPLRKALSEGKQS